MLDKTIRQAVLTLHQSIGESKLPDVVKAKYHEQLSDLETELMLLPGAAELYRNNKS